MPIKDTDCAVSYKVLIVGDSGVGKSAILNCLMGRAFDERSRPTVGMDFVTKIIEADGALIELRIWDTAGLENFRSMTRRQFHGVQGVILVYDVTNRMSFNSMSYWLSTMPNSTPSPSLRHSYEPIPFIVLANKADLTDRKKVGILQGMKMANKAMAFGFHETSAKTSRNVFTAFQNLAVTITDINHPKLMKSYHPYLIRPLGTKEDVMNASLPILPPTFNHSHSSLLSSSLTLKSSTAALPQARSRSLVSTNKREKRLWLFRKRKEKRKTSGEGSSSSSCSTSKKGALDKNLFWSKYTQDAYDSKYQGRRFSTPDRKMKPKGITGIFCACFGTKKKLRKRK